MKLVSCLSAAVVLGGLLVGANVPATATGQAPWPGATAVARTTGAFGFRASGGTAIVTDSLTAIPGTMSVDIGSGQVRHRAAVGGTSLQTWDLSDGYDADAPILTTAGDGHPWALWRQYSVDGSGNRDLGSRTFEVARRAASGTWLSTEITVPSWDPGLAFSMFPGAGDSVSTVWTSFGGVGGVDNLPTVARLTQSGDTPSVITWITSNTALMDQSYYQLHDGTIVALGSFQYGFQTQTLGAVYLGPNEDHWSDPVAYGGSYGGAIDSAVVVGDALYIAPMGADRPVLRFAAGAFDLQTQFDATGAGDDGPPTLVNVGDAPTAIWYGNLRGTQPDQLWSSRRGGDGVWSDAVSLDASGLAPSDFTTASDGANGLFAAWRVSTPSGAKVRFAHFANGNWSSPEDVTAGDIGLVRVLGISAAGPGAAQLFIETTDGSDYIAYSRRIESSLPAGASGDWLSCASVAQQMCVESATATVNGTPVDLAGAGLAAHVSTLDGVVSSFNWSISGAWNTDFGLPLGFDSTLFGADLSLVVRVGAWVPRMTSGLAKDLRITVSGDSVSGRTITLSGKPAHIDWDSDLSSCYTPFTADACGDDTRRATYIGTGWRFMGNTQDMGTWSQGDRVQRGGMYVATDAQGGPHMSVLALQFYTFPDNRWELKLGNPHLDVNGNPVRGSFNAWLPESYFTSLGTTVDAAIATGFTVTSVANGVTTVIAPTVAMVNGGVMISLDDIGYSVRTLTVRNETPPLQAPGVPTDVQVTRGAGEVRASWSEPITGGLADSYVATAYTSALGNVVAGTCSPGYLTGLSCTIKGPALAALASNTTFYVTVKARNDAGTSAESARQAVLTLPAKPALTASTVTSSSVSLTFPKQTGVTYSATAKIGQVSVDAGHVAVTSSGVTGKVTVTGIAASTAVTVTVRATNASGYLNSVPTTISTAAPIVKPANVIGLAASKIKSGKVTLTWSAVPATGAAVVYRYRWVKKGSSSWSAWAEVSVLKGVVSGWVKGTRYTVQIIARNSKGDSPAVTSATFTAT